MPRQGAGNAISINGSRPTSNNYLLDGTSNTDTALGTPAAILSVDAIQEFKPHDVRKYRYSQLLPDNGGCRRRNITQERAVQSVIALRKVVVPGDAGITDARRRPVQGRMPEHLAEED